MTCSDEELEARVVQAEVRGMARVVRTNLFMFPGNHRYLHLRKLTVKVGGAHFGPFSTVDEAVNTLILLGGGPE